MVVQKDHLGVIDLGYLIDRSIDQIMLFPITRAREGIYKGPADRGPDPRYDLIWTPNQHG